jgi:ABC-type transport system involved in cytochrome c biogenesis permease subunit
MSASTAEYDPSESNQRAYSSPVWHSWLRPLASLQLTVVLFVLSLGLVFFGTLAQKTAGIWTVVDQYFWSWFVIVDGQNLIEFGKVFLGLDPKLQAPSWFRFPYPAGKLLGGLLFLNLLAAHLVRFRWTWKRLGILVLHIGLLLLFVGEAITREFQIEQQMVLSQPGETVQYAFDSRNYELAFLRPLDESTDHVTVVPARLLRQAARTGQKISHPDLPVDLVVMRYMPNSDLLPWKGTETGVPNPATVGFGKDHVVVPRPEVAGVDNSQNVDYPAAYIRLLKKGTEQELGVCLVTLWQRQPQVISIDGISYGLILRHVRYYKPFTLTLLEFRFDRYLGTDIPKNYSSRLFLRDPENNQQREVVIRMNEPLRYRGEAFYQSGYTPDERGTILQVVRNPGWLLPYISCVLVAVGMIFHFGLYLSQFLLRSLLRRSPSTNCSSGEAVSEGGASPVPASKRADKHSRSHKGHSPKSPETPMARSGIFSYAAAVGAGLALLYLISSIMPHRSPVALDLRDVARLPVVDGGRLKPLDTFARVHLRLITHAEEYTDTDGKKKPAIHWFFQVAAHEPGLTSPAANVPVFRIENDQVRDLLRLPAREGFRYSLQEMLGTRERLQQFLDTVARARDRAPKDRDLFETKVLELDQQIQRGFLAIAYGRAPLLIPVHGEAEWVAPAELVDRIALEELSAKHGGTLPFRTLEEYRRSVLQVVSPQDQEKWSQFLDELILASRQKAAKQYSALAAWDDVLRAYRLGKPEEWRAAVSRYREQVQQHLTPAQRQRVAFEAFLNDTALFYHCTVMYLLAALACLSAWALVPINPQKGDFLRRCVWWWLVVVFIVHSFTLLSRMYLMERPLVFVTNLYSSAVFIGWAVLGLCLLLERFYPISVANMVGAILGFLTSLVAHQLATSGDTLEMMQAVLDTNFWLATHVTTITLGYAATYVAGTIGLVYVFLSIFPREKILAVPIHLGEGPSHRSMEVGRMLSQMIYAVVCFATLLSFTGTVLGGIWADQSWGRFWGWDPKENGAVMIVIWNALILHARWAGLVKERGIALLAIIGNMITTWSWFGTNQLGVGLHAYGFNNKLALGCTITWVSHAVLLVIGLIPWNRVWSNPSWQQAWTSYPLHPSRS